MAKTSGGNRALTKGSREYRKRQTEVVTMLASGEYSSVTMSEKGGGFVAIEKSSKRHKPEEIEAATILADKGYKVKLKNEAGTATTPDGELFSISFEQRTPTSSSVNKALEHAKKKGADIALIYDKNHIYHRADIDSGIKEYESLNNYRFKQIIVVTKDRKVHRHRHNE
jgi:hypothetical protein